MIFCPTPWLKAPALGGGQTPQSRGCGPGKLRGERRPGGHRLVGKGQPGRDFPDPCDYGLGHFSRFFFYSCGHTLSEVRSAGYTGPAWERSHTHTHTHTHTHSHTHTHTHIPQGTRRKHAPGRIPRTLAREHTRTPALGRKQTAHARPAGIGPGTVLTESRTCTHRPRPRLGGR